MTSPSRSTVSGETDRDRRLRPVFIGGCPRSGTTLLGAMLGIGPQLLTIPEARFKFALLAAAEGGLISMRDAREVLEADRDFDLWRVSLVHDEDPDTPLPLATVLDRLVRAFGGRVDKPDATIWIDHTPGNIRFAAALLDAFPDARIVNLVRDGRGVAASILPLDWGPNRMAHAASWWATHVAMGLALTEQLGPQVVRTVRFEDLVERPHETLLPLCEFLDIPFAQTMLTRRDYEVDAYTVTEHSRVSTIPDPSRARAWLSTLTPQQLEEFEYYTGELARYLDYPLLVGAGASLPSRLERFTSFATDVARRTVTDRLRRRRSLRRSR